MSLLVFFIILSTLNVIIQTIKSIATIKCGKLTAALINALAYGLYTVVIVYTNSELPLMVKALVTAIVNFIGVYAVKFVEERINKQRLRKIEFALRADSNNLPFIIDMLEKWDVSYNYSVNGKWINFNTFCENKRKTETVKKIITNYKCKYFVTESLNI